MTEFEMKQLEKLCDLYSQYRSAEKQYATLKSEIGERIKNLLGDEEEASTSRCHVIYKHVEKNVFDSKGLKSFNEELWRAFVKSIDSRPLKVC